VFLTVIALLSSPPAENIPAVPDTVVYEANLRAFGGFRALESHLNVIRSLGANVIWLMPVQPVGKIRSAGGLGSPYATADYTAVNPEFGTPEELRSLVKAAHSKRIGIILDWAADHTAWDNPWISSHSDWYQHGANGKIAIPAGTNWNDVAALNYSSQPMRTEMIRSMKGWITGFDIDGFRCDAADRMPPDFWKQAISELRASTPKRLLMLAEGFPVSDYEEGFDLTYGWDFGNRLHEVYGGKPATELKAASDHEAQGLPRGAERLRFITNHDYAAWNGSDLEFYKSDAGIRGAIILAALYGGVPMIYNGEEVDWQSRIPIFDRTRIDWSAHPEMTTWIAGLFRLRREHPSFRQGTVTDFSTNDVVGFARQTTHDKAVVFVNVRNAESKIPVPVSDNGRWRTGGKEYDLKDTVTLNPYESLVLVK